MRSPLTTLGWVAPGSLSEALDALAADPDLVPLAGCTDVFVALQFGELPGQRFLNLWGLAALGGIGVAPDGGLRLGALTTYTQLAASPLVREQLPMLVAAARQIGGAQIQNRGTLGGNIANGSPAGDTLPVLAAAEAVVILESVAGSRRIPFTSYYTGYRQSVRRRDELIVAVEVPPVTGAQWFRKVGTRRAQAISKVVMAAVRAPEPRIALGSCAPTVRRLPRTEQHLAGGGDLDAAKALLAGEIAPIDDVRSTAVYRRRVAQNLLARFWQDTE